MGGAEAAGAVLRDVAEEGGGGAVRPQRAGSIEENRLGTTGSTNESGAQAPREREEEPHCGRRAPEANHNTRARANVAARIRERAGGRVVDEREGDCARGRKQQEVRARRSARNGRAHLTIRRIKGANWAQRGESRG